MKQFVFLLVMHDGKPHAKNLCRDPILILDFQAHVSWLLSVESQDIYGKLLIPYNRIDCACKQQNLVFPVSHQGNQPNVDPAVTPAS